MSPTSKRMLALFLAAYLAALAFTCASCGETGLPQGTTKKMDTLLKKIMDQYKIPGAIAGAWIPGSGSWTKAVGESDVKKSTAEKLDLRFRIGSITKTFVTTVVLQLVDEKKLSLDDKLDKYVKGFKYGDEITIRQLANNTSGVFAYDDTPGFTETMVHEPQKRWKPEQLVDLARAGQPNFAPGTSWKYSNSNFVLQGVIVEKITGKSLKDEIQTRIVKPLGLKSTFLPVGSELDGPHSHGYVVWDGRFGMPATKDLDDVTYWDTSWAWAAGAMVSDMQDLHKWAKALATGQLLSKAAQKERLTWVDIPGAEALDMKYGLGILYFGGLIGHDGMLWGYNTAMYYYPEEDATIVVMFNRAMDQVNGEWISYDLPYTMAASAILFPGKMPWDKKNR